MDPARLPRALRLAAYALAVAVVLYLCLSPKEGLPVPEPFTDKVDHALAWASLTAVGLLLSPRRPRAILAFCLALGAGVEVAQTLMGLGRQGDWLDFAADAAGVSCAAAAWLAWRARRPGAAR